MTIMSIVSDNRYYSISLNVLSATLNGLHVYYLCVTFDTDYIPKRGKRFIGSFPPNSFF